MSGPVLRAPYWIALLALGVMSMVLAIYATREREAKSKDECSAQGGEWFDYGRFKACRMGFSR